MRHSERDLLPCFVAHDFDVVDIAHAAGQLSAYADDLTEDEVDAA